MPVAGTVAQTDLASAIPGNPRVVIGGLLVVLLAVAGWFVFERLLRSPGERFAAVLENCNEIAILMHPNPDPDAMACALATRLVADRRETDASIYYSGQIRHHENRAFETVLDGDFDCIKSADEIEENDLVLVDHNEARGFDGAETTDPVAVVDHHPGEGTGEQFTDVRPENGACATIFSEYLDTLGWQTVDPDRFETNGFDSGTVPPRIATGLVYGIQSDTKHLTNGCSSDEFTAAAFLYSGIDEDKLDRIANPDMDAESLEVKAEAITDREVRGPFAISDVGSISNVDAIPQAADELRRLEGINAVVVLGDVDNRIKLSGRSKDDRVHMGKVLETAVSEVPMADGGGHARMGGGQVPIDHMKGLGPGEGLTRDELKERLFDAMNGEL